MLAKLAVTADHISGGRIEIGMGAGWHEGEHALYGFDFPPPRERMARLEAQLEEVRASRARIVEFGDAERRRLERNLHDGAQQRLVNLSLALGIARSQVGKASDEQIGAALDEAATELRLAVAELRELARGIHPAILSEAGLGPAIAFMTSGAGAI